jgi:hypothetical protein
LDVLVDPDGCDRLPDEVPDTAEANPDEDDRDPLLDREEQLEEEPS